MHSIIVEVDAYKKKIHGYDPQKASRYHIKSGKLADEAFKQALKDPKYKKVILMCGGSASGKSELVSSALMQKSAIVYDGTLSSVEGAKVKIRNSEKRKKKVYVYAVFPKDIAESFRAFLVRDRVVPVKVFIETHSSSRETLLWLLEQRIDIPVKIYESFVSKNKLQIKEFIFKSQLKLKHFVKNIQLSEEEVEKLIQIQP